MKMINRKSTKEEVMESVRKNGLALQFASEDLKKDTLIYGLGVVKTYWSRSASNDGLGDVSIERINPQDFY